MNESYNRYINKTEDEILSCSDIVQLSQWKGVLEEKIAQEKISIGNIRGKGKGRLSSEEISRVNLLIENRAGNKRFLSLIMGRIRGIHEANRNRSNRLFLELRAFKGIAKKVLSEELYDYIEFKARQEAEERMKNGKNGKIDFS